MKEVNVKDLIVGQLYADCDRPRMATILEFVGFDKDEDPSFKYIKGRKGYQISPDGLIYFSKKIGTFYEYNEKEITHDTN